MKENGQLFIFSDNTFFNKGFTWAASILPRSEIIINRCSKCNAVQSYPSGEFDVILENGFDFPDVLGCGAYPFLILSEKVISTLNDEKVTALHTFAVGISDIKSQSKKLLEKVPPRYYRVEIDGRCRIDLHESGLEVIRYCPDCYHLVTRPRVPNGLQILPGSWDKSDLFRDVLLYPMLNFCNEVLPKLVKLNKFTNFRFENMQGPWNSTSRGLDLERLLPVPQ